MDEEANAQDDLGNFEDNEQSFQEPDFSIEGIEYENEDPKEIEEEEVEEQEIDFNENGEEEENDDDDIEADLKKLNEKLGTDFKDLDSIKNALKKDDEKAEIEKEKETFQQLSDSVSQYESYVSKTNEDLVRLSVTSDFHTAKKDINNPEVIQEIEDKIEALKDLGEIDKQGNLIRNELKNTLSDLKGKKEAIETKWATAETATAQKNKEDLQNAFAEFGKSGNFYGVKVTPDDIKEVYKEVVSGEFFKKVNSDQKSIAELALIRKFKDQIQKASSSPTHSDGIKKVFDELGQKTPRSLSQAGSGTGNKDAFAEVAGFVK